MTTKDAIKTLQAECGFAELDLSNGECKNEKNTQAFIDACHMAIQALRDMLPCRIGDKVWVLAGSSYEPYIKKDEIYCISRYADGKIQVFADTLGNGYILGKTAFLTFKEAKQELKKIKEK